MRLLFSLMCLTASFSVSAQVLGPDTDKQIEESIRERIEKDKARKLTPSFPLFKTEWPQKQELKSANRVPGVYALPQDNMPCIVPYTGGMVVIPNASRLIYPFRQDMPNAK